MSDDSSSTLCFLRVPKRADFENTPIACGPRAMKYAAERLTRFP